MNAAACFHVVPGQAHSASPSPEVRTCGLMPPLLSREGSSGALLIPNSPDRVPSVGLRGLRRWGWGMIGITFEIQKKRGRNRRSKIKQT